MAFSAPARANAYGPPTGLSSMVLQRKRLQGRTGHMINSVKTFLHINWLYFFQRKVCFHSFNRLKAATRDRLILNSVMQRKFSHLQSNLYI